MAGHIDYIVRYGPNKAAFYSYEAYRDILDRILKAVIEHGKGIECNTAGLRKGISQPNPAADVLKRYRELGGEILTIGSDAHIPEDLGADFEQTRELLKNADSRIIPCSARGNRFIFRFKRKGRSKCTRTVKKTGCDPSAGCTPSFPVISLPGFTAPGKSSYVSPSVFIYRLIVALCSSFAR